jgi:hypothetical protein
LTSFAAVTGWILEHDEVAQQVEEARCSNTPFQHHLQLGQLGRRRLAPVIVRQGLNHSLPAPSEPMRACTPSETTSAALVANSAGICAW